MVTEMDRASERLIRGVIAAHRPDDVVVGEEGGRHRDRAPSGVTWWVDPIDGTTNYVYDHPGYAVSIAAADGRRDAGRRGGRPDPRPHLPAPHAGGGAAATADRSDLGPAPPLPQALVATGFGYDPERRAPPGRSVAALLPRVRDIRRHGRGRGRPVLGRRRSGRRLLRGAASVHVGPGRRRAGGARRPAPGWAPSTAARPVPARCWPPTPTCSGRSRELLAEVGATGT